MHKKDYEGGIADWGMPVKPKKKKDFYLKVNKANLIKSILFMVFCGGILCAYIFTRPSFCVPPQSIVSTVS